MTYYKLVVRSRTQNAQCDKFNVQMLKHQEYNREGERQSSSVLQLSLRLCTVLFF